MTAVADRFFVDTNVLVYAHDAGQGARGTAVGGAVGRPEHPGYPRALRQPAPEGGEARTRRGEARRLVEDYLCWPLVVNDGSSILGALQREQEHGISFWDALILDAANRSGARVLYSEALTHGQTYGATTVVNPFGDGP